MEPNYNLTEVEKITYENNVLHLKSLLLIQGDFNAKRTVSKMLQNLDNKIFISLLSDNLEKFKMNSNTNSYELLSFTFISALCKSKPIFEYLCDRYPFCKEHKYIISYAICSKDVDWVMYLIDKLSIDINDYEYCFWLYVNRVGMDEIYKKLLGVE